jgi:hypothetical protein
MLPAADKEHAYQRNSSSKGVVRLLRHIYVEMTTSLPSSPIVTQHHLYTHQPPYGDTSHTPCGPTFTFGVTLTLKVNFIDFTTIALSYSLDSFEVKTGDKESLCQQW